jgi:hypothetical protein
MSDIKVEFRGDVELLKAFAEHARKHGLAVTLDELLLNSKKGGVASIVILIGGLATIATAVARFQEAHKTQIEITTPAGTFKEQNYTVDDLEKILPSIKTNIFIRPDASDQPPKP